MPEEITQLDNKYIVIKRADLKYLHLNSIKELDRILDVIDTRRHIDNKPCNNYLVLNVADYFDVDYILENIPDSASYEYKNNSEMLVNDFATIVVNAILKTKVEGD